MDSMAMALYQSGITLTEAAYAFEKRFIMCVLEAHGGNKCAAARAMGMHRNTLDRHIAQLKIHTWKFSRPGTRRVQRKQLYASKERPESGEQAAGHSALAPSSGRPLPVFGEEGGRGESSEPSRGGPTAHLAQDRKPPCVDPFLDFEVECGGLKA
jgi:hypothetical protein